MSSAIGIEAITNIMKRIEEESPPIVWMNPTTKAELDAIAGDEAPLKHILIGDERRRYEIRTSDDVPAGLHVTDNARLTCTTPSQEWTPEYVAEWRAANEAGRAEALALFAEGRA